MGLRGLLLTIAITVAGAQVLDRIAVVVGNKVITETEVRQEARLEAFLNQTAPDFGPQTRRAAADRLVNQQLVRNEMQVGAYAQPTEAEIEGALRSFRQEHFSSIPQYRASLEKYGITEEQLKSHLKWQLAAIHFTDQRFSPAVTGDGTADRAIQSKPGDQASNSLAPPANADDQFEAWLKQARASTKIQFKDGAFQ
jgi:hypothetical protein